MTPTQRSIEHLKKRGYRCAIVEHWNSFARRRIDLYGFIDILAISPTETLAVQTTTGANLAARITKAQALPSYADWLASEQCDGWHDPRRTVEFHGWAKRGARGKRKLWEVRIERHCSAVPIERFPAEDKV